jgi:hypothetical protein
MLQRQGLGNFVGQPNPSQVFIGVFVTGLLGADDRQGIGQLAARVVMVTDDQVYARASARSASRGERMPQSTVITSRTPARQMVERFHIQAVAFFKAVGDIGRTSAPKLRSTWVSSAVAVTPSTS